MEFEEVLTRRRSTRAYAPTPVDPAALDRVLRAAMRAPSAGNRQAYRICLVRSPSARRALARAAGDQAFLAEAPVDLVFFIDPERSAESYGDRGRSLYAVQDATIAAAFAVLAATNEDLASAWVGAFDEAAVREVCREAQLRPVAIVPLGRGAETPRATPRRPLREMVREL